jgi:flagellar protein FliO/FliZ
VLALGYTMKRLNGGGFKSGGDIRVVSSTFLGPKERILLLEVRDRQILVGVNPQCIRTLAEFPAGHEGSGSFREALGEARTS